MVNRTTKNNGNRLKSTYVVKDGKKFCKFYLVNPNHLYLSIDALAEQLISMKEIKEIYINDTNESKAFDVMVRFTREMEPKAVESYIKERLSNRYGAFSFKNPSSNSIRLQGNAIS